MDGISPQKRAFVANGIRAFFNDILTQLVEKETIVNSLNQVNSVFTILVWLIGAISLTITFFLLLISTTTNVKEAVWEYGVLRSMGVTRAEGSRIAMYEAFMVVGTAAILGTGVGFITAVTIAA